MAAVLIDREALILAHRPLAKNMARKVTAIPYEDALQEAMLGLSIAAAKFDADRGVSFGAYAVPWITETLQRAAVRALPVHVPLHLAKASFAASRRGESLLLTNRAPKRGISAHALANLHPVGVSMTAANGASMDFPEGGEWAGVQQENSTEWKAESAEMRRHIYAHLARLTMRQQRAVLSRFGFVDGEEKTLDEVATEMGISREGVRQLVERALCVLRGLLAADGV